MAWTASNLVSVSDATEKDHYDKLWDNADYLKDARDDTDEDSYAAFVADDHYKVQINSKDAACFKTTGVSLGWHINSADLFDLSQYGMTLHTTTKVYSHLTPDTPQAIASDEWTLVQFNSEASGYDNLSEYNTGTYTWTCSEAGYYLFTSYLGIKDADDAIGYGVAFKNSAVTKAAAMQVSGATDSRIAVGVNCILSVAAGVTIQTYCYCGGTGDKNILSGVTETYFMVHRLS